MKPSISVACGVLRNARGELLLAQRPEGKIAAGYWEFPGGKIEDGEPASAALARELDEELGIIVREARPLIRVRQEYLERSVTLDTWLVTAFDGTLHGREGQAFAWLPAGEFGDRSLLPTVQLILPAAQLPSDYVFTPVDADEMFIRERLSRLPVGALLRLRLPALADTAYDALARRLLPHCDTLGLKLMLDRDPQQAQELGAAGWHANAMRLAALEARPLPTSLLIGASAHTRGELLRAAAIGADFGVLGHVLASASHAGRPGLGWTAFEEQATSTNLPVYAIGGVGPSQQPAAFRHYAQGTAGISAYWT